MDGFEQLGRWSLPSDWRWLRAKDFASVVGGGTPKDAKDPSNYDPDGTPWITPADLSGYSAATIKAGARSLSADGFRKSSARRLPAGTVLISSRAPVGYCVIADGEVTTNQGFRSLVLNDKVDPFFIRYYVLASKGYLEDNASGTTFKELPGKVLGDLLFPIPPLDTQRRIVARIDELFSELDDGEAALARARADLETYRKSLLKAAVTGELTAYWRAANPPTETGEQLLQRILADRRARWEADPKNKGKRYKAPEAVEIGELAELPKGWTWASFGQIFDRVEAGLNVKALSNPPAAGETGIVKLSAVTWWDFNEDASKTLISGTEYEPAALIEKGDFLISRANTLELVGAPAIVSGLTRRLVLSDKVLRLVMPERLKRWCFFVLRSPFGRAHIESLATGNQLSMRNISQDSLRRLPIPIPPSDELARIIDLLTASLEAGTEAGLQAAGGDVAANQLRQSILAAAFRGELVQ